MYKAYYKKLAREKPDILKKIIKAREKRIELHIKEARKEIVLLKGLLEK